MASRSYFYVGGRYEDSVSSKCSYSGRVMTGQMYVEKIVPQSGSWGQPAKQQYPIVFMTGGSQTATNWLNTPDGRAGWASYFLSKGYIVYLVDQPQRGRSPWVPTDGTVSITNVTFVQNFFTSGQKAKLWPQAHLHTQWPGSGEPGDSSFDAFYAGEIQQQTNSTKVAENNINAFVALLDLIGDAILISHSQAGPHGWGVGDRRPDNVKAIIALEPEGPPFENQIIGGGPARPYGLTTLPLTYSPAVKNPALDFKTERVKAKSKDVSDCVLQKEPARKLVNLSKFPVLLYVTEASYHAYYDHCTLAYMQQAGMDVDYLKLPEVGIMGNAHFSFMEKNNMQIAPLLDAWIRKVVRE
ncbi:alpha/beta-hydrolase [Lindgomyces ingoldianus]|uniref:Alpha/beta-hydrolase n=1 Tax=Lindgomyces ingoldianus TaxID=673940 RepID=A0ACB6QSH4_9PLEO|nr:alpha/beta-hydrolase [Lindgomyces ingoldianus]KAF2469508.1 alpha/beta-hydrolase [Lindgomyces ingoldianus]